MKSGDFMDGMSVLSILSMKSWDFMDGMLIFLNPSINSGLFMDGMFKGSWMGCSRAHGWDAENDASVHENRLVCLREVSASHKKSSVASHPSSDASRRYFARPNDFANRGISKKSVYL